MLDLGPHASFTLAAYGVTLIAVAALVLATVGDDLKQRHLLAELERQGIKRRSAAKSTKETDPPRPAAAKKPAAKKLAAKKPAPKRKTARKAASPRTRKTSS